MFLGFNVKGALDYAFLSKKTRPTLFLFIAIQFGIMAVTIILVLPTLIPFIGILFACCLYFVMLVFPFIYALYDVGTRYEVMQSILDDKPIPDLTKNLQYLFKEGLKIVFVRLLAGVVAMIPLFIVITFYVILMLVAIGAGAFIFQDQSPLGMILFLLLLVVIEYPLIFIVNAVVSAIVEPAVYHYIKNGRNVRSISKYEEIGQLIKLHWKKFFTLAFIITGINLLQFLFLLPFLLILIIGSVSELVAVALLGFFLVLIAAIPLVLFNTGFNALAYPHLIAQIFKKDSK